MDAAISDSCFGYEFGAQYMTAVRKLTAEIGIRTRELPRNGRKNTCCGLAAYLRDGNIRDLLQARKVKREDIKQCGSSEIVNYCQGCYLSMELFQSGVTSHYLLEKVLWALGDDITDPNRKIISKAMNIHTLWNAVQIGPSALF
jgi:hypothetical protein